jgi:hypothetical protein
MARGQGLDRWWRRIAAGAAAAMAVTEVVSSIGNEVAWPGFVAAALFAAGAFLVYRAILPLAALVLVAALFVLELAFLPFYTQETPADWILQGATTLVSAVGLGAAGAAMLEGRGPGSSADDVPRPTAAGR